jgi:hypothetical protein
MVEHIRVVIALVGVIHKSLFYGDWHLPRLVRSWVPSEIMRCVNPETWLYRWITVSSLFHAFCTALSFAH